MSAVPWYEADGKGGLRVVEAPEWVEDPRHIPAPGGAEFDVDAREAEQLTTAQRVWDDLISMFDHPGWTEFQRIVQVDRDGIDAKLTRCIEPLEWKILRGQLDHADWILRIEEMARAKRATVVSQLRDLMEGAESDG